MRFAKNKHIALPPIKQKRSAFKGFPARCLLFTPLDSKHLTGLTVCLLSFVACWLIVANSYAGSPQEKHYRMQKDIITQEKKLGSAKKAERFVLKDIKKANIELNELKKQLKTQQEKIKETKNNISALQKDINDTKKALQIQSKLLKKRLAALQRHNKDKDIFLIFISGEDISETTRMLRYIRDISAHDRSLIKRYRDTVGVLNKKQSETKKLLTELKLKEGRLSKVEESLKEKRKEKEAFLISARKEKKSYERMIRELREASNRLLKIIQRAEKRERELKKRNLREKKDLKTKEQIPKDTVFAKLQGGLPWPVVGTIAIQYGRQVDPVFNLPIYRSGIHIRADRERPVKAVQGGKVVFADQFKGYGQIVVISHGGGYHSLYGNLSRIFISNGDIIKKADVIGEVGESDTLGTSGLYFEIRYRGNPLDPQQWLKR